MGFPVLRCARQLKPKSRRRLPRCCAPSGRPVEPCVRQLPHTVFAAYGTAPGIEPSATTLANAHQIVLRRLIKAARETLVICTYGQHRAERFRMFGGCIASVGLFGSADTTTIPQVPLKCR